MEVIISTT